MIYALIVAAVAGVGFYLQNKKIKGLKSEVGTLREMLVTATDELSGATKGIIGDLNDLSGEIADRFKTVEHKLSGYADIADRLKALLVKRTQKSAADASPAIDTSITMKMGKAIHQ